MASFGGSAAYIGKVRYKDEVHAGEHLRADVARDDRVLQVVAGDQERRLQRVEAIGFDDVMLICHDRSERHLASVRALI